MTTPRAGGAQRAASVLIAALAFPVEPPPSAFLWEGNLPRVCTRTCFIVSPQLASAGLPARLPSRANQDFLTSPRLSRLMQKEGAAGTEEPGMGRRACDLNVFTVI